jgi:tripartite-type tricarboxylate transporter receptor subunit TctC
MLARLLLLAICTIGWTAVSVAQSYPARPITMVVPFAAGGSIDIVARQIAARLGAIVGQSVIVDNKAGAGGTIGTGLAAKAAPDGYTMLLGTTSALGVSSAMYRNLPYDPIKSFIPVIEVTRGPFVLTVRNSLPANNLAEFLDHAKRNRGKLNFGSAGIGSVHHLAGEILKQATGIDMTHVPFKGSGPAWTALLSGDIDLLFDSMPGPLRYPGKVRPIAVAGPKQLPGMPDIPTFAEAGLPGVETVFFWAMLLPAGTPADIVARLNSALGQTLRDPALQSDFAKQSMEATPGTSAEITDFMSREIPRWQKVVQAAGIRAE